jgi:hypothetical protein
MKSALLFWIRVNLIAPLYRKTFCRMGQHWLHALSGKVFSKTDFLWRYGMCGDLRYSCDSDIHERCKRDEKEIKARKKRWREYLRESGIDS